MAYAGNYDRWFMKNQQQFERVCGRPASNHPAIKVSERFRLLCEQIKSGDVAAVELAIDFLKEDPPMPFGRTNKSQIARSLKRVVTALTASQVEFLRSYAARLLQLPHPPREADEFVKLLRKVDRLVEQKS